MQYFQNFEYEIKINIFKYVKFPLNLILTCRNWSIIAKDPYAKYEWLIVHYGKAHALFHAITLGPTFVDVTMRQILSQTLIARKVIRLCKYNPIELKIVHNFGQLDVDKIRAFQQSPRARNLLTFNPLANVNLLSKGNNMELFRFLSTEPHVLNYIPRILGKSLKITEDLILNKLIAIPPRPKLLQLEFINSAPHNIIRRNNFLRQRNFLRFDRIP
jgi:hypothetical protein